MKAYFRGAEPRRW